MGNIAKTNIHQLAIPAIIANIIEPIISLTDTAVIGHLGKSQLAGVGIATALSSILVWVLAQSKSAVSSIFAQLNGQNELAQTAGLASQNMLFQFIISSILALVVGLFSETILEFYKCPENAKIFGLQYLNIRLLGLPFIIVAANNFGIMRGLQNTRYAMYISLIGGIINILLDFGLVYGLLFFPALGVKGAAWASVISYITMFLISVICLKRYFHIDFKLGHSLHPELKNLVRLSFHLAMRAIALNTALFWAMRLAGQGGETTVSIYVIMLNIWLFTAFFLDGYSSAANAISGKLLGERNYKMLQLFCTQIIRINLIISASIAAVLLLGYHFWPLIFTQNKEIIGGVKENFFWVLIIQPIGAVAFTLDGVYKGTAKAISLRNALFLASFVVFIPLSYVLTQQTSIINAIWFSLCVWMLTRVVYLGYLFYFRFNELYAIKT